jgi:hypothetical protein
MDKIRISCACLARILFDTDKYLLIQNRKQRNQGIISYGPIGGALEYNEEALEFLMSIDTEFETGSDLRIHIPADNFQKFKEWFLTKKDRETTIFREMYEEIVMEEKFLTNLIEDDIEETFSYLIETTVDWDIHGEIKTTFCFFEIYDVKFKEHINEQILLNLKDNESLKLFTSEEIQTLDIIAGHAKFLTKTF